MQRRRTPVKMLLRYLRPCARSMSYGFTIKVLATLLELMLPYILSHILDVVVPRHDVWQILLWGGVMILCAVGAYYGNVIAILSDKHKNSKCGI